MGWVYLVKRKSRFGNFEYLRQDGKLIGTLSQAREFESREEAEAKAFIIVSKYPEWIGKISVVRHGYNGLRER